VTEIFAGLAPSTHPTGGLKVLAPFGVAHATGLVYIPLDNIRKKNLRSIKTMGFKYL
jgi:hypothetical protein